MTRIGYILSVAIVAAWLIGGCPGEPSSGVGLGLGGSTEATADGVGTSTASSDGAGSTTGGTTADTQSYTDPLTEEFPDCTESISGEAWRSEILRLVNEERAREGLPALVHNETLEELATRYACEMIHYDFFAHENPVTGTDLVDRAEEFGIWVQTTPNYMAIGENLAAGQTTPAQVMEDWMNSVKHRDNILNPNFTELGVGVRTGGSYRIYWVQEFGKPWGD
jgi:uncharacterized protein YkwD